MENMEQVVIREMRSEDARIFVEVHRAAVWGTAAKDYPLAVIEAWAPLPITESVVEQVRANPEREYRLVAEVMGRIVGMASLVSENRELRACYVLPDAGRKGVGAALLRAIEHAARQQGAPYLELDSSVTAEPFYRSQCYDVREPGFHTLRGGQRMSCVKMLKTIGPNTVCT